LTAIYRYNSVAA